jgi:hypothetical protein
MSKSPFGATGNFPQGKISDDDEGELILGVAWDDVSKNVIIDFGKSINWIGLDAPKAILFANSILRFAAKGDSN